MKHRGMLWTFGICLWLICALALGEVPPAEEAEAGPKRVKVGLFLTNLYDIDLNNNEYNVQFWAWFLHDYEDYNPVGRTEIVNAKQWTSQNEFRAIKHGKVWDVVNFRALINEQWDVSRYPFDTQTLHIHLEDIEETSAGVQFVPDTAGTRISEALIPDGWRLKDYRIKVVPHRYDTAFGDPSLSVDDYSEFSRITLEVEIQREGARLFTTIFIGFFVATLFIIITLAINMSERAHPVIPLQPRVTLASGAIFATIGSIYILVNEMPYTTDFTLADSLLTTTSLGTVFCIISSVMTDVISKTEKVRHMYRVNKFLFAIFILLHFGINTLFLTGTV